MRKGKANKADKEYLEELKNRKKQLEEKRDDEIEKDKNKEAEEYRKIKTNSLFLIKKGTSSNYMDYTTQRLFFNKFQALSIYKEKSDFY